MKTYRIVLADYAILTVILITIMSFTVIGLPAAIALLPTLYEIVETPADRLVQ